MTKTKQQLRAEAVERLTAQLDEGNTSAHLLETVMGDVQGNGANWNAEIHALIDLLTDDYGPCYSCARLAELMAENSQLRVKVDELKAMNEKLQVAFDAVEGCDERCKKLEAERDEWKAKDEGSSKVRAGSSSAKRAAAVERLNGMDEWCDGVKSGADFMKALLWDLRVIDEEHVRDALIDLLTDESMDEQRDSNGTCPNAMGQSSNISENLGLSQDSEIDSREKLEADVIAYCDDFLCTYKQFNKLKLMDFINRQAAITERECLVQSVQGADAILTAENAELQARVDELTCNDALAPEKVVTQESAVSNDGNADTREKLEEDANGCVVSWWQSDWVDSFDHANSMKRDIMRLLDRQAAITKRETKLRELYRFEKNHRWHIDSIEEVNRKLNERIEELNDENEHIRSQLDAIISSDTATNAINRELQARVDEYEKAAQGEFVVPLEDVMRFTTDPPGYVKAHIAKLQERVAELTARLEDSEYDCATCDAKNELQDAYDDMVGKRNELLVRLDEMADRKCPGYDPELHYCRYHAQDFELNRQTVGRLKRENAELQAKLESAHEKNRSLRQHIAKMQEGRHGWHVKYPELEKKNAELQAKADRLARENVALARDLGECMAERDGLRRENAKLSDDEFYLRCKLVDMDGEVVG